MFNSWFGSHRTATEPLYDSFVINNSSYSFWLLAGTSIVWERLLLSKISTFGNLLFFPLLQSNVLWFSSHFAFLLPNSSPKNVVLPSSRVVFLGCPHISPKIERWMDCLASITIKPGLFFFLGSNSPFGHLTDPYHFTTLFLPFPHRGPEWIITGHQEKCIFKEINEHRYPNSCEVHSLALE